MSDILANLKGWRSFLVFGLTFLVGFLQLLGITNLPADAVQQVTSNVDVIVGAGMSVFGVIGVVLRAITTSPIFKKVHPDTTVQNPEVK